jgi:Icc-related predicted phosphoesterase
MTKMRFIGDVHAKFLEYQFLISDCEIPSIQVGDFGIGFNDWNAPPIVEMVAGNHRFIRGNHDNLSVCKKTVQWIPDGTVEGNMMFVGGAWSIDRPWRTEGVDWWPDEELSIVELTAMIDTFVETKPEIMVTHDCPHSVADLILLRNGGGHKPNYPTRTGQALEMMFAQHQPKIWIFGHWHINFDYIHNGTRFICLGELSHIDLDI